MLPLSCYAVKRLEQAAWLVMTKAVQMQEQSQHQEKEQELHQHSRQRNQLLQQQVKGQQQQDQEQQQQQQRRQQPSLPSRGLHASKRVALAISRAPDPASASQPAAAASPRQPVVQATPQQLAGVEAPVEVLRPASPSKAVRRRQADQDGGQRKAPRVNTHPCVQAAQQKQRQPTQAIASEEVQTDAAVAVAALPSRVQRRRTSKQALPLQVAGSGTLEQAAQQSGPCLNVQVELEQQVSVSSQDGSEAAVRKASRGTSPQLAQDMAAAAVLVASHTALEQGAASRHAAAGTKCVKVGSAVVAVAAEAQAAPAAAAPAGAQDNSAAVTEAGAADTTQQAVSADAAASTAAVAQGATLVAATAPPLGINSAPVAARPTVAAKTSRPATLPRPQASAAAAATAAAAAKAAGNVQFTEVDVTLSMAPEALVGMPIKVYWPLDRQFYTGKAVSYDASTCKHRISYADGDAEERVLAVDRVQVGLRVQDRGRQPAPTSQQLKDLTAAVEKVANEMQVQGSNRRQGEHSEVGWAVYVPARYNCLCSIQICLRSVPVKLWPLWQACIKPQASSEKAVVMMPSLHLTCPLLATNCYMRLQWTPCASVQQRLRQLPLLLQRQRRGGTPSLKTRWWPMAQALSAQDRSCCPWRHGAQCRAARTPAMCCSLTRRRSWVPRCWGPVRSSSRARASLPSSGSWTSRIACLPGRWLAAR